MVRRSPSGRPWGAGICRAAPTIGSRKAWCTGLGAGRRRRSMRPAWRNAERSAGSSVGGRRTATHPRRNRPAEAAPSGPSPPIGTLLVRRGFSGRPRRRGLRLRASLRCPSAASTCAPPIVEASQNLAALTRCGYSGVYALQRSRESVRGDPADRAGRHTTNLGRLTWI